MLRTLCCSRALIPRFLLGNTVLAWQCSICGKMFSLSVEEAQRLSGVRAPQHLRSAFACHNCELEMEADAERAQKRTVAAPPRRELA